MALRDGSEEVREKPGYIEGFATKTSNWNIKRLVLIKEKKKIKPRHLKLMNLALFSVWEDARV